MGVMSARLRLGVAMASLAVIAYLFAGLWLGPVRGDSTYSQLSVFSEVMHKVIDFYVDPVNVDRTMSAAEQGLTESLDGDTAYLDGDAAKLLQPPGKDSDAEVGLELSRRYPFLIVVAVRPGSPAQKAGIRTGDVVKLIDGKHTRSIPAPVGVRLLRGAPGSAVKLTILRTSVADPLEMSLVRQRLAPTPPESKMLADGTGYLKLAEFSKDAVEALRGDIEALKKEGAKRLVLDLRGAAFGSPENAVAVAELFQKGGVVTRLQGKDFPEQVSKADPARSLWDLPLVALVDTSTAGPGEVLAAALLDSGRPVVGERTFGRAGVQKNFPLPEGAVLVVTVAKYSSPKGEVIHGRGVEPSVAVSPDPDASPDEPQKRSDRILEKALEILGNPPNKPA
jgi:carboxyl-terminal processing protease